MAWSTSYDLTTGGATLAITTTLVFTQYCERLTVNVMSQFLAD